MGSGAAVFQFGKYIGDGVSEFTFKTGFQPKHIVIRSVVGAVVYHEGLPGPWKQLDSAVPSFLTSGVEIVDYGFKVSGADAALNQAATEYYWEAF